jgi:hypothetical protein
MARTNSSNPHSRLAAGRKQTIDDHARQRRQQHRAAPRRSVSSLSATQLERKRANDREAQRLIRQRTKDRIDSLEKQITELRLENERLNGSLKSKTTRDRGTLRKRHYIDTARLSLDSPRYTIYPGDSESIALRGLHPYSQSTCGLTRTCKLMRSAISENANETGSGFYLSQSPGAYAPNHVSGPSIPTIPPQMSIRPFGSDGQESYIVAQKRTGESQTQFEEATPSSSSYPFTLPSYPDQPASPLALHCVLPNGQLHLLRPGRQPFELDKVNPISEATWSM